MFGRWVWRWARGRVAPGSDAQKGVGSLSRRLFRAALAPTPPPSLAAAALKGQGKRAPSSRRPPRHLARPQRSPNTPYIRRHREAEENFLGVGCSILGVGCLQLWALGVGCLWRRRWALDASGEGVGRWMPLAKALGSVGGPREATARWEPKYRSQPRSGRQQGRLGLESSTAEVQVTRDPEVCSRFVRVSSRFHRQPTPK